MFVLLGEHSKKSTSMPSVFSCHDTTLLLSDKSTRIVPHISQLDVWDCGVACVAMICSYVYPKRYTAATAYAAARRTLLQMYSWLKSSDASNQECDESSDQGNVTGVNGLWTIHLALLLRRLLDDAARDHAPQYTLTTSSDGSLVARPGAEASAFSRKPRDTVDGDSEESMTPMDPMTLASPSSSTQPPPSAAVTTQVTFFTTCLGVNPNHRSESYYQESLHCEEEHVLKAFADAASQSVQLQKLQLTTLDMIEMLQEENGEEEVLFLCLVDATKLQCNCRHAAAPWGSALWNLLGYTTSYVGHYVVVTGYEKTSQQVLYRNPATPQGEGPGGRGSGWLCAESVATFDLARSSEGTDHDTILVRIC